MIDTRVRTFRQLFAVLSLAFAIAVAASLRDRISGQTATSPTATTPAAVGQGGATPSVPAGAATPGAAVQAGDNAQGDDSEQSRVRHGFDIAPVALNLKGRNIRLVGLGSYLVNAVGGCNDCHTNPPYVSDPHLGLPEGINTTNYLAGGMAFGPFISRNLTPDGNGNPAGLTLEKFIHIIRTGEDDDKIPPNVPSLENDLLQVMPWPLYRHMRDGDLQAIYEYLSAIPHAEPAPAQPPAPQAPAQPPAPQAP